MRPTLVPHLAFSQFVSSLPVLLQLETGSDMYNNSPSSNESSSGYNQSIIRHFNCFYSHFLCFYQIKLCLVNLQLLTYCAVYLYKARTTFTWPGFGGLGGAELILKLNEWKTHIIFKKTLKNGQNAKYAKYVSIADRRQRPGAINK